MSHGSVEATPLYFVAADPLYAPSADLLNGKHVRMPSPDKDMEEGKEITCVNT